MAGVKISALTAMDALTGTETLVGVQTTTKRTTTALLAAYAVDTLVAAATATPTVGDYLLAARGSDEKRLALADVATYANGALFDSAAVTSTASGDLLALERTGAAKTITIDNLTTSILTGIQATVLNISALSAATLADADQYLVVQGTTAVKTTWASMAARAHSQFSTAVAALGAVTVSEASDKFYCLQGSTAKYVTSTVLATYMETALSAAICADVWDNADAAVTPVVAADVFVLERAGVRKTATGTALGTFTTALLTGADAVTPAAAGDKFVVARSGVAKTLDIDVLATYVGNKATTAAGTETTFAAGDLVVFNRAGAVKTITIANVVTHVLTGVQATVLNISALDTATLADAQLLAICDGTTGKKATLGAVCTYAHAGINAYTQALTSASPIVDGDVFYVSRAAAPKSITASGLATYMVGAVWNNSAATDVLDADVVVTRRAGTTYQLTTINQLTEHVRDAIEDDVLAAFDESWELVAASKYTATPASTSQVLMSDTSMMQVGFPLRYAYGGVSYYGVVAEVSANTYITIRGAALNTGVDLTALHVGPPGRVVVERIAIPGAYLVPWHVPTGTGSEADMLAEIARRAVAWRQGPAKLVAMAVTQGVADGVSQPKFNVSIDGDVVLTQDTAAGIQVSATPGTWTWASAVGIDTTKYSAVDGDAIEIVCTASGSDGEAGDLSVELLFVLE